MSVQYNSIQHTTAQDFSTLESSLISFLFLPQRVKRDRREVCVYVCAWVSVYVRLCVCACVCVCTHVCVGERVCASRSCSLYFARLLRMYHLAWHCSHMFTARENGAQTQSWCCQFKWHHLTSSKRAHLERERAAPLISNPFKVQHF